MENSIGFECRCFTNTLFIIPADKPHPNKIKIQVDYRSQVLNDALYRYSAIFEQDRPAIEQVIFFSSIAYNAYLDAFNGCSLSIEAIGHNCCEFNEAIKLLYALFATDASRFLREMRKFRAYERWYLSLSSLLFDKDDDDSKQQSQCATVTSAHPTIQKRSKQQVFPTNWRKELPHFKNWASPRKVKQGYKRKTTIYTIKR